MKRKKKSSPKRRIVRRASVAPRRRRRRRGMSEGTTLAELFNPATAKAGAQVIGAGAVGGLIAGGVARILSKQPAITRYGVEIAASFATYAVGDTGGSADSIVVSHTHTATVTDPGHTHTLSPSNRQVYNSGASGTAGLTNGGETFTQLTMSSATTGITVENSSTGSSGTNANLPPYYALCYIMKT